MTKKRKSLILGGAVLLSVTMLGTSANAAQAVGGLKARTVFCAFGFKSNPKTIKSDTKSYTCTSVKIKCPSGYNRFAEKWSAGKQEFSYVCAKPVP